MNLPQYLLHSIAGRVLKRLFSGDAVDASDAVGGAVCASPTRTRHPGGIKGISIVAHQSVQGAIG